MTELKKFLIKIGYKNFMKRIKGIKKANLKEQRKYKRKCKPNMEKN